ncbi:hypothetical protein [Bradyrhizobium sp. Ash2021]|uniref:hypothetical protein n=1 Tax=Bradyrhizobium sp. Ash2021 TaxID=2954771 RepID=UPI0028163A4C|nr:hypothetical protein [Bradyrhizobium sp. Ash2021]WMT78233.1 hypothetical protein NL528_18640 [Bradyrhizobium sp. Ash2021]
MLFVVVMAPPRKPRTPPPSSGADLSPAPIHKNAHPFDQDEPLSLRHLIISVAMGAFFVLAPPLIEALDSIKRLLKKASD